MFVKCFKAAFAIHSWKADETKLIFGKKLQRNKNDHEILFETNPDWQT